ncbi:MAG: zinc-dependent peptidase [Planctomycetota bacterium]
MFRWFAAERDPFDPAWEGVLERGVWQYPFLDAAARQRVRQVVAHLVARKIWTGGSGFAVTDAMRVTVSGVAALMTVGLDQPFFFPKLTTVILYPTGYDDPDPGAGVGLLHSADPLFHSPRLGEAWQGGPVVLSWRTAQRQARVPGRGRNLVLHEMAHHLDGYAGDVDGTPYFHGRDDRRRWCAVTDEEYHRLVGQANRREVTLLDHYGATNHAEFFAVATECFFERPHAMRARHAGLFELMAKFFCQDPTAWLPPRGDAGPEATGLEPRGRMGDRPRCVPDLSHLGMSGADEAFSRGVLLLQQGEYRAAARTFGEVLSRDPGDAEAQQHRAEARLAMGDLPGAIADCEAALATDSDDAATLLTHAAACLAGGDDAAAGRSIARVLREDRGNALAWLLQGQRHAHSGELKRAIRALRRAVRLEPYDAQAHLWLADCLGQAGASAEADRHRRRAVQLDPEAERRR